MLWVYIFACCAHVLQVCGLVWVDGARRYPIVAHGRGNDEAAAKREASCNLLANLAILESSPSYPITDSR